jgi:hypothetical protein
MLCGRLSPVRLKRTIVFGRAEKDLPFALEAQTISRTLAASVDVEDVEGGLDVVVVVDVAVVVDVVVVDVVEALVVVVVVVVEVVVVEAVVVVVVVVAVVVVVEPSTTVMIPLMTPRWTAQKSGNGPTVLNVR